jgi:hypothetical protein
MMFRYSTALLLMCVSALAAPEPKKLGVVRMIFAQMEDGDVVGASDPFVPGETVHFRCNIEGFKRGEKDVIHLSYQVEAKDSRGLLLQSQQSGNVEATLAPEDKDWLPKVRETIVIPPLADSGEYQVFVTVKDELAGASAEGHAKFTVKGRDVPASETLVVRNFRFLRREEDSTPLAVPAYRPGDALWARFDMTGYQLGEGNQFDVDYGLTVLRADGSTAYAEPKAAELKDKTFYPQRYQPGALSLNFPKDQKPGEYTIVLSVRDNVGKQTYETKEKFSVE